MYQITTEQEIGALVSPARQEIIDAVVANGPSTVAQIGEVLGRPADALYYHVRRLVSVGLLRETDTRRSGSRDEAIFDLSGRPMRVVYDMGNRRLMNRLAKAITAMLRLADDLQLTKNLPRTPEGHLTDQGKAMRKATARGLRGALSFRQMAAEADRDRVRIEATGSNPEMVVKMTSEVRDNYFEISKTRFLGMLADAQAFYRAEIEDTLQRIEAHENEMDELQPVTTLSRTLRVWPDLGEALSVSRATAYDLVRTGAIRSFKCGRSVRVSEQAVQEFIEAGGTDAA